jgi:hypothetical protein|tara:strand:+ start:836 stop:991 length:156 start_codon:yes stop_codon:yes gene_type:complete
MNFDDFKVIFASATGLGNWLIDMDVLVKLILSCASLVYVILKIKQLLENKK